MFEKTEEGWACRSVGEMHEALGLILSTTKKKKGRFTVARNGLYFPHITDT
jgi:hypothetical protein